MSSTRSSPRTGDRAFKTASGEVETLRSFLNTAPGADRQEALESPEALARWLKSRGLLAVDTEVSESQHRHALELRQALVDLLRREPEAQNRFETLCRDLRYRIAFDERGVVRFHPVTEEAVDRALATLVGIFIRAQHRRTWRRLKACQECGRAFFDRSNNRTGKWCSHRCGERVRTAAARRRKRARRR